MDWFTAIDEAIKCWEELRLKRASVALIHGGMLNALIYFLGVMKPTILGENKKNALGSTTDKALEYFSKNPQRKAELVARLAQHGIALAELQAKAIELNGLPLQMVERMIAARENGRRQLRKEAVHSKAKRQNGDFDA